MTGMTGGALEEALWDSLGVSTVGETEWTMVKNSGVKKAKVGNEQQFSVGVGIISKDVFVGDPLTVSKMVKDELGKVESVRVTRSGMMPIVWQQRKRRKLCVV